MFSVTSAQEEQALKQLREKKPSREVMTKLLDGYLTTLIEAGRQGALPDLASCKKALGLAYDISVEAGIVTIELLYPGVEITTSEMQKRFTSKYRAATREELRALVVEHPYVIEGFSIVSLVPNPEFDVDFGLGYPFLSSEHGYEEVKIVRCDVWYPICKFAVVRK